MLIFLVLLVSTAYSDLNYGLDYKSDSTPITQIQIFAERCAGSFYFTKLVWENFFVKDTNCNWGAKHFPPWLMLPKSDYFGPDHYYTFEGSEDTLFLVIFRNPYDWIRSFYLNPFHASPEIQEMPFDEFIRTPWKLNENEFEVIYEKIFNPLLDMNPETKQPFENVLKLRSGKAKNMLMLKDKVKNIYFINYETVRDFPEEVVEEIGQHFKLKRSKFPVQKIVYYKGEQNQGLYKPKTYPRIKQEDLDFINSQLDWKLEKRLKYQRVDHADAIR